MSSHLMKESYYELFPYDAGIGVRGVGWTEQVAFENAALALTSIAFDPEKVHQRNVVFIHCQAPNHEILLVNWLNALIHEASTCKMVFGHFRVNLFDHRLEGIAWGYKLDHEHHQPTLEAKRALDTELQVEKQANGRWVAQCVIET